MCANVNDLHHLAQREKFIFFPSKMKNLNTQQKFKKEE